jgi:hypothetical protein
MEKLVVNPSSGVSVWLITLENVKRDIFTTSTLTVTLDQPSKIKSESSSGSVSDEFHIVSTSMNPFTYYTATEIQTLGNAGSIVSQSLAIGSITAKLAVLGFSCINPFMAILIKNILVLEFCSVLIMLNLKFPLQIRNLLTSIYTVVQQELVENFYQVNLRQHS